MAARKPVPVITSGKTEKIGQIVVDGLKPEVEVTHFVLAEASNTEIPALLASKKLDNPSSALGTGNDDIQAKALILGGAYHDDDVSALQELVKKAGGRHIAWLRVDSTTIGAKNPPDYAAEVAMRSKAKVLQLEEEGKLDNVEKDAVYFV